MSQPQRGLTSPDRDPCANPDERSLLSICLDQARVYGKTFAANQIGCNARLNVFEYATKDAQNDRARR